MSDWYEDLITQGKDAYYAGNPIMSDVVFDKVEELLRHIKPNSNLLKQVGSKK
jgi:NAD-dependent DNA ligase